jgi:hypothetical protein
MRVQVCVTQDSAGHVLLRCVPSEYFCISESRMNYGVMELNAALRIHSLNVSCLGTELQKTVIAFKIT